MKMLFLKSWNNFLKYDVIGYMKYKVSPTSLAQIKKKKKCLFIFIIENLVVFVFYPSFEEKTLLILNESKLQYPTSFVKQITGSQWNLMGRIFFRIKPYLCCTAESFSWSSLNRCLSPSPGKQEKPHVANVTDHKTCTLNQAWQQWGKRTALWVGQWSQTWDPGSLFPASGPCGHGPIAWDHPC